MQFRECCFLPSKNGRGGNLTESQFNWKCFLGYKNRKSIQHRQLVSAEAILYCEMKLRKSLLPESLSNCTHKMEFAKVWAKLAKRAPWTFVSRTRSADNEVWVSHPVEGITSESLGELHFGSLCYSVEDSSDSRIDHLCWDTGDFEQKLPTLKIYARKQDRAS